MKRIVCVLLVLTLVFALAACGEPDPNCGVYVGTFGEALGIKVPIDDYFDGGFSVELKDGGSAVLSTGGEDYRVKWSLDGENLTITAADGTLSGTLSDGVMVLEDVLGSGVTITLER